MHRDRIPGDVELLGDSAVWRCNYGIRATPAGLLHKILAELESFMQTRQVLLATHSPVVLSSFKAPDLRLVRWTENGPTVRALSEGELSRVTEYLHSQGSLGEFVFEGGLSDDGQYRCAC